MLAPCRASVRLEQQTWALLSPLSLQGLQSCTVRYKPCPTTPPIPLWGGFFVFFRCLVLSCFVVPPCVRVCVQACMWVTYVFFLPAFSRCSFPFPSFFSSSVSALCSLLQLCVCQPATHALFSLSQLHSSLQPHHIHIHIFQVTTQRPAVLSTRHPPHRLPLVVVCSAFGLSESPPCLHHFFLFRLGLRLIFILIVDCDFLESLASCSLLLPLASRGNTYQQLLPPGFLPALRLRISPTIPDPPRPPTSNIKTAILSPCNVVADRCSTIPS